MTDTPETAEWEPDEPDPPAEADTTPTDEQPGHPTRTSYRHEVRRQREAR